MELAQREKSYQLKKLPTVFPGWLKGSDIVKPDMDLEKSVKVLLCISGIPNPCVVRNKIFKKTESDWHPVFV